MAQAITLEWKKLVAGPHRSARATDPTGGYYCFHFSGYNKEWTVFHMHPFFRLGVAQDAREAIGICQNHYEVNNDDN